MISLFRSFHAIENKFECQIQESEPAKQKKIRIVYSINQSISNLEINIVQQQQIVRAARTRNKQKSQYFSRLDALRIFYMYYY